MALYTIIAAVGENNEIGAGGRLPWSLPADIRRFKELTIGHAVIMGHRTWDSLTVRPLPKRRNIVMTTSHYPIGNGAETAGKVQEAVAMTQNAENEVFVIGGAQIYSAFEPLSHKMYLTRVHASFAADTFFPIKDFSNWQLIEENFVSKNHENNFDITFQTYEKIDK
ncbi:MAG: dihydrofolate reductase [Bacteroidales bacterium]|nr:dihydrofolate reductase [Bacteroidales bacterium]